MRRWMHYDICWPNLSPSELRDTAEKEIESLGFRPSLLFEIYWSSCVDSDYCMFDPTTFNNILVPRYLPPVYEPLVRFGKLIADERAYPPKMYSYNEVLSFDLSRLQHELEGMGRHQRDTFAEFSFLPSGHALYKVLGRYRGRLRMSHHRGRPPKYPDRLAVHCAVMKHEGRKYTDVAKELGLPITKPNLSRQSDVARHLVERGQALIEKLGTIQ
jgi:hypothetical protein